MSDGWSADIRKLAKNAPPDYSWMDSNGFK